MATVTKKELIDRIAERTQAKRVAELTAVMARELKANGDLIDLQAASWQHK